MGIGAALEIGKNGIAVYRMATEVTGENIANVNTPGYSRQRVVLETSPPTTPNGFPLGSGVRVAVVERYYDALLQQQMVNARTALGYDTAKSGVLQQIEPSFNEVANDGLGAAISGFFSAWQDLSVNPSGTAERQSVITKAQILTDNFNNVSSTLSNIVSLQNASLTPLVASINATLKDIAQLNSQIATTELVNGNANELRDRRDLLVRDLSTKVGITFKENSDGTTDVTYADSGDTLVSGTYASVFSLDTIDPENYVIQLKPVDGFLTTVHPATGELGAAVALRDTIIPAFQAQLDDLAATITSEVNMVHTAGYDLNGDPGAEFFDPLGTGAAAFGLNSAITNTSKIAASSNAAVSGDNGTAQLMTKLQGQKLMSSGTLTFNSYFDSLSSQVGLSVKSIKTTVAQDEAFSNQLDALRESNSGVSLDEELTNLVKYQRSYQASAKLITTATEMLDTVIAMLR